MPIGIMWASILFLSTLSLRRATLDTLFDEDDPDISIHALLAESDLVLTVWPRYRSRFLSTLSLRRATYNVLLDRYDSVISIHALLAESDCLRLARTPAQGNFYPRSPCGERLARGGGKVHNAGFLSTLSLRRATDYG